MEGKTVKESSIVMTHPMSTLNANMSGNVHGGVIMRLVDEAGGAVTIRHTRTNVVTASIDRMDFHNPVFIGNLLTLKASLNLVGRTSMEVGVHVQSEDLITGEIKHTASAYLTYVALDEDGRPVSVPSLIPETREDVRRNREALTRRETRLCKKNTKK